MSHGEVECKGDRAEARTPMSDHGDPASARARVEPEETFDIAAWFRMDQPSDREPCMTECWFG
jgi:hypothetical protein